MSDELIKRLRGWRGFHQANLSIEAADRIEQLTAGLADAEALIEAQAKDHASNNVRFAEAEHRAKTAEAERDRLRALLAEAASDLTTYVDAEYPPDTCDRYPGIANRRERDMELVRRIEAELKGEREQ